MRVRVLTKRDSRSNYMRQLVAAMTNINAIGQTLVSERIAGSLVRDYALMCAAEANRLLRLVEHVLDEETSASQGAPEYGGEFNDAGSKRKSAEPRLVIPSAGRAVEMSRVKSGARRTVATREGRAPAKCREQGPPPAGRFEDRS